MDANTSIKHIIIIMDQSGSMSVMGDEPKEAVNIFLNEQNKQQQKVVVSLWLFNHNCINIMNDKPLDESLKLDSYKPEGMTAMYDAITESINSKKKQLEDSNQLYNCEVSCVIISDGQDNSSIKSNMKDVKQLITDMESKYNWLFVYLGANQDSFSESKQIGINMCGNFDQTVKDDFVNLMRQTSDSISKKEYQLFSTGIKEGDTKTTELNRAGCEKEISDSIPPPPPPIWSRTEEYEIFSPNSLINRKN